MMSDPNQPDMLDDEVLSAYFDGELPPDRKAKVERQLSNSPAAQQKLDDIRRLSGFLQELPRGELPAEFAAEVLQHAERRMLLPAVAASQPLSPWRKVRFWTLSVVAPLTATAALLFIALHQPDLVVRPVGDIAQRAPEQPAVGQTRSTEGQAIEANGAAADVRVAANAAGPANLEAADVPTAASVRTEPTAAAADSIVADSVVSDKTRDSAVADEATSTRLAALVDSIQKANESGLTSVVRVYVVDRRDGMELVQLILDKHQIPRDSTAIALLRKNDAASDSVPPSTDAVPSEPAPTAGQEALFVVADAAKLREALAALLAQKERSLAWKLDEPVDLHRLDRRSQQRVEETLVALGGGGPESSSLEPTSPKGTARKKGTIMAGAESTVVQPASPPKLAEEGNMQEKSSRSAATIPSGKVAPGLATVKSEGGRPAPSVSQSSARQLRVTLAEPSSAGALKPGETAGESPVVAAKETELAANKAVKDTAASRRSLVRVILVIEPQAPAAAPGKAAPAEPDSGGGAA